MIQDENKIALIRYRIDQAKATVDEARVLIDNNMLRAGINRIYYGMFYILLALALKYDFETSKHQQLIGWFNKTFIKGNQIDIKYGKMLREAYDFRQQGDYAIVFEFTNEDVVDKFNDLQDFIITLEKFILA